MYKHILLPVAPEAMEKARREIDVARRLADDDTRITLLAVIEPVPPYVAHMIPEETRQEVIKETAATLSSLAEGAPRATAKTITGNPGRAIVDFAEEHDVDLVIMASHKPEASDIIFGSTAAWVVRHCPCSLHVIR